MTATLLGLLGGQGVMYLAFGAGVLAALTLAGVFLYRAGANKTALAQERVTAAANANLAKREADAWNAAIAIPADPAVVLRKHDV